MARWFDIRCNTCGDFEDVVLTDKELDDLRCPNCDGQARTILAPVLTVGAMPSKPIALDQLDRSFDTNADWRKWKSKNPNSEVVSVGDKKWRDHYDKARNKAEKRASAAGFKDAHHRKVYKRDERKKRLEAESK